jgi:hypothetical protein
VFLTPSQWKPLLDNALIECPVFVLGLKSDTRPQHPTVQLGFDPKPEPVSEEMVRVDDPA